MYKCKNHIINVLPGKYSITDYNTCNNDNNYIQFAPLLCQKCGREDRIIYSQGLCKSCYYSDKQYNVKPRKYNYQPKPKKENIERIAIDNRFVKEVLEKDYVLYQSALKRNIGFIKNHKNYKKEIEKIANRRRLILPFTQIIFDFMETLRMLSALMRKKSKLYGIVWDTLKRL